MNKISRAKAELPVSERLLITPMFVFFIIHSMQVGVGILGFEGYIAKYAGFNSWISILIAGAFLHLMLWMIYQILQDSEGDIVSVHRIVFGKYIGAVFSLLFSVYYLFLALTVLRTFIEVIQVWVFPSIQIEIFALAFILLVYYMVIGGFRLVTGLCLISTILTLPLLLLKFFPIEVGVTDYLYPVIDASILDLLKSAKASILGFLGIELLFIFYPFIKKPDESKKWAHFAVFYTVLIYLVTALVSFLYYSEEQLKHVTWGTISLWKIVHFPFIERFEYIGIALWVYVIVPNICLALWGASRIPKRMFVSSQKAFIWLFCFLLYIFTVIIDSRQGVEKLNDMANLIGFYVLLYIPLLFILMKTVGKWRKKNHA
ncbi:GerAB/ArcD/ProY family transporter [Halobacillus massiliensis]|uniref:GerAB/ArcD/ProY family transporter n=1 Tax=Halobacillus massiliensis TaxID=1926286 RepID=UPI0015C49F99|nr:GerAB/ArcD/ProY family transporter [Halobacillus massiliensis]